jgi:hypothetical protein
MMNPNMAGMAPPQGVSNDQTGMPAPSGQPMPPSQMPPMDPSMMPPGAAPGMPPQQPKEKPPSMIPAPIADSLAKALNSAKLSAAQDMATRMGDPRGTAKAGNIDILKVWRKRNPTIDPLYEKLVNHKSDEDILDMMYPMRKTLVMFGNRTYQEQVDFAEKMAKMDNDPKYADLSAEIDEDEYEPPASPYPSQDYEKMIDNQEPDELAPQPPEE